MIDSKLLQMLVCPVCKSKLFEKDGKLVCSNERCNKEFRVVEGIPIMLSDQEKIEKDMKLTRFKWEKVYQKYGSEYYSPNNVPQATQVCRSYIEKYMGSSAKFFLEAGCGTARNSLDTSLNHNNLTVVCLDITLDALLIAKKLFEKNNASGFFVCGDMKSLPFNDGTFDFIFSDGAVEHFKDTQKAIDEFFRILRKRGRVLVTVPYISISVLTHGQLHGNTPNIPVLRQALELVHMQLLNGKLMKNGYELSFTQAQVKNLFREFSYSEVGPFPAFQELRWLRIELLRKIVRKLLTYKLFWYMIYGFGVK
jgi:ubiquinone/menaquinone biosynthesis C-methylase UbiE